MRERGCEHFYWKKDPGGNERDFLRGVYTPQMRGQGEESFPSQRRSMCIRMNERRSEKQEEGREISPRRADILTSSYHSSPIRAQGGEETNERAGKERA